MSHLNEYDQDDKPLDPAMENVRRKMVRLQLVSGGVMLVMFMAVLAAIVYKVTRPDPRGTQATATGISVPSDQPLSMTAALPAGFEVVSTSLSGSQVLFYGRMPSGESRGLIFDVAVGRIVADIAVTAR